MIEDFLHLPPWQTLSYEYLREFSKKFETTLMVYSGAWGKLIYEKIRRRKSCGTAPFNMCRSLCDFPFAGEQRHLKNMLPGLMVSLPLF